MKSVSQAGWKLLRIGTLTALSAIAVQTAQAGPVDPLFNGGQNNISDASGERIYRCTDLLDGSGAVTSTTCALRNFGDLIEAPVSDADSVVYDVFAGVLSFSEINTQPVAPLGQLTALFAVRVEETTFVGGNPLLPVSNFGAASANAWDAIFGGVLGTNPMDDAAISLDVGTTDDTIALLYQDSTSVLPGAFADSWTAAVNAANNGTLGGVLGLLGDDFFQGTADLTQVALGLIDPDEVGCGTEDITAVCLTLRFAATFQQYDFSGAFTPDALSTTRLDTGVSVDADVIGSGNLFTGGSNSVVRCDDLCDNDGFQYANNIDASFVRVPEPATLGLLGMSLIGFAGMARRRRIR